MTIYVGETIPYQSTHQVNGVLTDADSISAIVFKPDGTQATLTPSKTATGTYLTTVPFTMVGDWQLAVIYTNGGYTDITKLTINVYPLRNS